MVDGSQGRPDGSAVPTIADLLLAYRDRTGASYGDMSRKVDHELGIAHLQKLVTQPIREFPKSTRTVELLAQLLDVPPTTIVLAYAASLGIAVTAGGSGSDLILPPGTDSLTDKDRDAVRAVVRALIDARTASDTAAGESAARRVTELHPPRPDLRRVAARRGESEGRRLRDQQDRDAD